MISSRDRAIWTQIERSARDLSSAVAAAAHLPSLRERIDDLGAIILSLRNDLRTACLTDIASETDSSIVLSRKRLLQFLIVEVLGAESMVSVFRRQCGPLGPSAREKLSAISSLSNVVNSLYFLPTEREPTEIIVDPDAVIHTVCEFVRREFGLQGSLDIEHSLRSFAKVEPALYLWREAYRDHLMHAVDVCLLGWFLLNLTCTEHDEKLVTLIGNMLGIADECVYVNWFLAALLHDVGYCIDAINQALTHTNYLRSEYINRFRNGILEAISNTSQTAKQYVPREIQSHEACGLDHGVIGYLHLSSLLSTNVDDGRTRARFEPACRAILKHNLRVPISFAAEPLTALLVICDELQEWERPKVSARKLARQMGRLMAGTRQIEIGRARILESLELKNVRREDDSFRLPEPNIECCLAYRVPEKGKFYSQIILVEKCHNMQRLDPEGCPLKMRFTLTFPYLRTPGGEFGLEALRSYALRRRDSGLTEFVNGSCHDITVIQYGTQPGNIEKASFDLELLNRFPLLPKQLLVDWGDFIRWSVAHPNPYDIEPLPLLREDII